jgi:hypothetical protein
MNHILRNSAFICLLSSVFCLYFVAGCESSQTPKNPLAEQVETLTRDKREMMRQIEQLESENKGLQKQIKTLHGLPDDTSLKEIYEVKSVRITKYTNLFDKDNDGKMETLIVYIQPVDQEGDIIKIPGDVHVQLLDLDKEKDPVVLGKWHLTPVQMKKLWLNAFMKTHYRLTFDITGRVDSYEEPLTVMVTFTDYLTGKVFEEQKQIKPQ